jgi:hypothetical protein
MGYLRCDACGAKALSAASTCPRCHHVLDLYDAGGRRVALRRCSGCALMHRADRTCPACGEAPVASGRPWALRAAAAVGVAATVWVGASLTGGVGTDRAETAIVASTSGASRAVAALPMRGGQTSAVEEAAGVLMVASADVGAPAVLEAPGNPEAPREAAPASDSLTWQPAVARTWVNVRSDASPDGEVVGVIRPDERALLGTTRRGWRRVTLDDVSGWVDPRLFSSANAGG